MSSRLFQHNYIFKCLTVEDYVQTSLGIPYSRLVMSTCFDHLKYSLCLCVCAASLHQLLTGMKYCVRLVLIYSGYVKKLLNSTAYIYLERIMPINMIGYTSCQLNINCYPKLRNI
jgi:hypothetical protein